MGHLPVGEPQDSKAKALHSRIADAVRFERGSVAVVSEAVGLDHQSAIAPEEVDLVGAESSVHLWLGKAVAAREA